MKKVIILSTAVMLTVAAFAQDTIPKNSKDSLQMKSRNVDSLLSQGQQNLNKDPLGSSKPDSLFNKSNNTDSLNTTGLNGDSKLKTGADTTKVATMNSLNDKKAMADSSTSLAVTDRVMMKEEKMYLVKNGENTLLDKSYKLESGVVVSANGNVKFPSGKTVQLKNGQFIELRPIEKTPDSKTTTGTKKPVVKKKISHKN